jgi:hypothetical protein
MENLGKKEHCKTKTDEMYQVRHLKMVEKQPLSPETGV